MSTRAAAYEPPTCFPEMSSPVKKRKTNDYKASSQPVRSLDYFFTKQKDAAKPKLLAERVEAEEEDASRIEKEDVSREEQGNELYEEGPVVNVLSDEELARKLQEQWEKEDQAADAQANGKEDQQGSTTETTEMKTEDEPPKQKAQSSFFGKIQGSPGKTKGTLSLQSTAADEDTVTANITFDESPLTFEPTKYIPDLQKHWATDGGHASYALLTRCFVLINGTSSRIKIVDTLVNLLRCIIEGDPDSLLPAVRVYCSLR
jgi:DNA ligase-1